MSLNSKFEEKEEAGTSSSKKSTVASMELTAFEGLPDEVKDEIFQYLPCKIILEMALVSKSFNFFIGTSSKVMSRFKITLDMHKLRDNKQKDYLVVGERNYSTVNIG